VTKAKISEYDATAANNTDANGVNIAEGCAPSGINNAIREVMAALKRFETGSDGDSVTVGGNLVVSGSTTANTLSTTVLQSDTINEKTSAAGVTVDGVVLKDNGASLGGNLTFTGTGNRITGDFSNATLANRVALQTSTTNSGSRVGVLPNGTSTNASIDTYANSDTTNASYGRFGTNGGTEVDIRSDRTGSGTYLPMTFFTGGSERMRIDTSGNVGIGVVPSSDWRTSDRKNLQISGGSISAGETFTVLNSNAFIDSSAPVSKYLYTGTATSYSQSSAGHIWSSAASGTAGDTITFTERMRIDTSGRLLVNKTSTSETTTGVNLGAGLGGNTFVAGTVGGTGAYWGIMINRQDTDGSLITFRQANTDEGSISVSGTTVSYNGGHLSRWAQTTTAKDESLKKGTVLSNLDEMNVYVDAEGNPVDNEQLNKVKVSDVEGDANVAGVFVNWTYDETHQVDEINMAMTGDMIVRIAQGVTVARGDLLMSAGDGTAMPQGDDIVRSKTIAKVTSTHVTCTYDDGSYCVPCVLMAC
jgi:ethanolamine utilization protein EutQ (cupin superfamily)